MNTEIDWIDCCVDNRKELIAYLQKQKLFTDILDSIAHPEANPFSSSSEETIVLNQAISGAPNIYSPDYISVIVDKKLVITITPAKSGIFTARNIATYSEKKISYNP